MSDMPPPDAIIQTATGFLAAKQLFVAVEIGLFEKLAKGPAGLEELAKRTQVPARTLRIITDAMVALHLVERQGDRYSNTAVTATYLAGAPGPDIRPFLIFWNRISYVRWTKLEEAVRTDRIVFDTPFTEEEQKLYSNGVEAVTAGGAHAFAASYDFGAYQRILDLGGGTGSFLVPILSRFAKVQATLFDLPVVVENTRRRFAGTPYESRVRFAGGNFFKDPIPTGHDAVIIADIVHCFPADQAQEIMHRVRQAVSPGTRAFLVDFWTNPTHTDPPFAALMAGEFLLTPGRGDVFSVQDATGWFERTGWRMVELKPLAGPANVLVADAV